MGKKIRMKWRKLDILDEQQQAAEHGIYDNQAHMVKVGIIQSSFSMM